MAILTKAKELYAETEQTISKPEFDRIEFRYVENLQEIKRKSKIEKAIQDVNVSIDALKIEINSDERKLHENEALFNKNKDAKRDLEVLEDTIGSLEKEMSEIRQRISGRRSELKILESNLHELEKEVKDKKARHQNMQIFQQTNNWLEQHFITSGSRHRKTCSSEYK